MNISSAVFLFPECDTVKDRKEDRSIKTRHAEDTTMRGVFFICGIVATVAVFFIIIFLFNSLFNF